MQSDVGMQQEKVGKDGPTLRKRMKDHRVHLCHHLRSLLAECVLDAHEDQLQDAGGEAGLYAEC